MTKTDKEPNVGDKSGQTWFKNLISIIPRIKTPIQLAAFALIVLIAVLQASRGVNTFVISLAIVSILLIMLASAVARRIETGVKQGPSLVIFYCGLIFVAVISLFLAFYIQLNSTAGELTWSGGHLNNYVDTIKEYEHVDVSLDDRLKNVVICKEFRKFHGQTPHDILIDVAWKNKDCLIVTEEHSHIIISRGEKDFIWVEKEDCHKCGTAT
jgi:hypothetical protein